MKGLLVLPLLLAGSACVPKAPTASGQPPAPKSYAARGNEPGWHLLIQRDRIDYTGNYGEKKISVPRPTARPSFNGLRYETPRLIVDITYSRCNDDMSGHGYEHQVMVTADGETYRGCGGDRRPDWDM
jgi:uncharacterized membrane protein